MSMLHTTIDEQIVIVEPYNSLNPKTAFRHLRIEEPNNYRLFVLILQQYFCGGTANIVPPTKAF